MKKNIHIQISKEEVEKKSIFPQGIELQVCEDIAKRQKKGIIKYGVSVLDNPLSKKDWLQHAYEEALDLAIYLKRAMKEL